MSALNMSKYHEISQKLRDVPIDTHVSSYEWEELVEKLYSSENEGLHEIGARELYELLKQRPAHLK